MTLEERERESFFDTLTAVNTHLVSDKALPVSAVVIIISFFVLIIGGFA